MFHYYLKFQLGLKKHIKTMMMTSISSKALKENKGQKGEEIIKYKKIHKWTNKQSELLSR